MRCFRLQTDFSRLKLITPSVGNNYRIVIEELQRQTGWQIKLNPNPNQAELIHSALELLHEVWIVPRRTPGIFQAEELVRVELREQAEEEVLRSIEERFREETGYRLEWVIPH